jgi:hypothetical protein
VQAATWACRKAIEASGINPNRIGVICYTGVWRDFLEPGMAVCVHHELALPASCIALDVTNACVDWVNGLLTVASMIEGGVCDYALVVDAEVAEVGHNDQSNCYLFFSIQGCAASRGRSQSGTQPVGDAASFSSTGPQLAAQLMAWRIAPQDAVTVTAHLQHLQLYEARHGITNAVAASRRIRSTLGFQATVI